MKKIEDFIKEKYSLLFTLFIIAGAVLYLMVSGGKYVWADEAYTFAMLNHNWKEIWTITAADVHPPLYYWYAKALTLPFGYSLFSAKITSILPYIFIMVFGGIQLKKYFGEKVSLIFLLLFLMFPYSHSFAIEIRMYSLAAAFVFSNAVYAYRCYVEDSITNWVFLVITGLGAAYTHYFALVSVGLVYGLLLIAILLYKKTSIKYWFIAVVASILAYIPWLKEFINQLIYKVDNEYWISPITIRTVIGYFKTLFGGIGISAYGLLTILFYFVALVFVIFNRDKWLLCISALVVPFGTIAVGVLASALIRPVFVLRYVSPALPLLLVFMAIALGENKIKPFVAMVLIVALFGGIVSFINLFNTEYTHRENVIDDAFISKNMDCDSYLVLTRDNHIALVVGYYDMEKPIYWREYVTPDNPFTNMHGVPEFDSSKNSKVVVLTEKDEMVPEKYLVDYECEYFGQFEERSYPFDVYILSSK